MAATENYLALSDKSLKAFNPCLFICLTVNLPYIAPLRGRNFVTLQRLLTPCDILIRFQEMYEEIIYLAVRFRRGCMTFPVGHSYSVLIYKDVIHSDCVIQCLPPFRGILRTAGDKKRPWSHKGMYFM